MKIETSYYLLPDPEDIIMGIMGQKSGGIKSLEIEFYPNDEITKTKEFKAFAKSLQTLWRKAKKIDKKSSPLINLVPKNQNPVNIND